MYWTKKDKRLFLLIVIVTTVIVVLLTNEIYFKVRVEGYIKKEYGKEIEQTEKNSELTLELLKEYQHDSIGEYRD